MSRPVLGWDIGGANIKVARVGESREAEPRVFELPFALWREPHRLPEMLRHAAEKVGEAPMMAVTMTGELADCFATKREGVASILEAFRTAFPEVTPHIYGVDGEFRSVDEARRMPEKVAAANWRASAALVARNFPDALFVDVGSTTTDIIPIVSGRPIAAGTTDTARLMSGELIYTGVLRSPICSIVASVPIGGRRCRVAAEHFAIAADLYRWLDRIGDAEYTCETPDGRGPTRADAGARLARIVCGDMETLGADEITELAEHVGRAQVKRISNGLRQVMRRLGADSPRVAVLAGQGTFLGRAAAEAVGLAARDLAGDVGAAAARAAPAAAVAYLLAAESNLT